MISIINLGNLKIRGGQCSIEHRGEFLPVQGKGSGALWGAEGCLELGARGWGPKEGIEPWGTGQLFGFSFVWKDRQTPQRSIRLGSPLGPLPKWEPAY